MKKQLEKNIQSAIIQYLRLKKFVVVKYNSAGIYRKATDSYIPQPQRGVSDILALSPHGQFFAFEVKREGGKTTEEQEKFLEQVNHNKGIGMVVRTIDDVMEIVQNELKHLT